LNDNAIYFLEFNSKVGFLIELIQFLGFKFYRFDFHYNKAP